MTILSQRTLVKLFRVGGVLVHTGDNGTIIKRHGFGVACILESA